MKYSVLIQNRVYAVEILEEKGCRKVSWEGKPVEVNCDVNRMNPSFSIIVEGQPYEASVKRDRDLFRIDLGSSAVDVQVSRGAVRGDSAEALKRSAQEETISAPMPGMVVAIKVDGGQDVTTGEPLLILEAMKMENELRSPVDGRISEVCVKTGSKGEKGGKLLILKK